CKAEITHNNIDTADKSCKPDHACDESKDANHNDRRTERLAFRCYKTNCKGIQHTDSSIIYHSKQCDCGQQPYCRVYLTGKFKSRHFFAANDINSNQHGNMNQYN